DGVRGWINLAADAPDPAPDSPALIVQHPQSLESPLVQAPLRVAYATPGFMPPASPVRLRYKVSTRKRSSGSPVFDGSFRAVGLPHNRGAKPPDDPGLVIDNRGVPLGRIVAHLPSHVRAQLVPPPRG